MTINEIIEKNKNRIKHFQNEMINYKKTEIEKYVFDTIIAEHFQFLDDLESAQQTQNELIDRLIKCYKKAHSENDIKFLEKITGKKWEEILNG